MKKSLVVVFVFLAVALAALPLAYLKINSQGAAILITEEPIMGERDVISNICLQIATQCGGHLFWDTEYMAGGGKPAESVFRFSSKGEEQKERVWEDFIVCDLGVGRYEVGSAHNISNVDYNSFPFPEVVSAVAGRTASGEQRQETVCISDYYDIYPIYEFWVHEGRMTINMRENTNSWRENLSELFHISTAEDSLDVTVEKDEEGRVSYLQWQSSTQNTIKVISISAFGEKGCYYTYRCDNEEGAVDRGEERGIFFIPYEQDKDRPNSSLVVRLDRIVKVCELPQEVVPVEMILDEDEGRLYLAALGEDGYILAIYGLDGESGALLQQILVLDETENGIESLRVFQQMTLEDGGILMTWSNNRFSFVAQEDEQYHLWYCGEFPEQEKLVLDKDFEDYWQDMEFACLFDGERLVLAFPSVWNSVDVLLAAYRQNGLAYCGLYRHSGASEVYTEFLDSYIVPRKGQEGSYIRLKTLDNGE